MARSTTDQNILALQKELELLKDTSGALNDIYNKQQKMKLL